MTTSPNEVAINEAFNLTVASTKAALMSLESVLSQTRQAVTQDNGHSLPLSSMGLISARYSELVDSMIVFHSHRAAIIAARQVVSDIKNQLNEATL